MVVSHVFSGDQCGRWLGNGQRSPTFTWIAAAWTLGAVGVFGAFLLRIKRCTGLYSIMVTICKAHDRSCICCRYKYYKCRKNTSEGVRKTLIEHRRYERVPDSWHESEASVVALGKIRLSQFRPSSINVPMVLSILSDFDFVVMLLQLLYIWWLYFRFRDHVELFC